MVTGNFGHTASVRTSAAVTKGRFVTATASAQGGVLTAAHSALNGKALGVTLETATASGEDIPVQIQGIAVMEAGETLVAGDDVGAIANGLCGKTSVTNVLGVVLEAGTNGTYVRVRLVK